MLVRIANRKDLLQKQSDLGLHCLSRPFWHATSVQNLKTFTIKLSLQQSKFVSYNSDYDKIRTK